MHDLAVIRKLNAKPGNPKQAWKPDNARSLPDYIAAQTAEAYAKGFADGKAATKDKRK